MELNAEMIKKALDWLDSLVGNSNDSDIAMFTYQLLGILYDTCEELTEKNAIQVVAAIELDKQVERLTEENERLKDCLRLVTSRENETSSKNLELMFENMVLERQLKNSK